MASSVVGRAPASRTTTSPFDWVGRQLVYHAESDALFEIDGSELPELFETPDGALCNVVTGDPHFEKRFINDKAGH